MNKPTRGRLRGQAMAEFALSLPILLAGVLGAAEGGYYALATVTVQHATQEGARVGVLETTVDRDAVRDRVQAAASAVIGLSDAGVSLELNGSVCDEACYQARVPGDRLKVVTTYTHAPLTSYIFPGLSFPASAESELWVEL